jgi:hypothetical protein
VNYAPQFYTDCTEVVYICFITMHCLLRCYDLAKRVTRDGIKWLIPGEKTEWSRWTRRIIYRSCVRQTAELVPADIIRLAAEDDGWWHRRGTVSVGTNRQCSWGDIIEATSWGNFEMFEEWRPDLTDIYSIVEYLNSKLELTISWAL